MQALALIPLLSKCPSLVFGLIDFLSFDHVVGHTADNRVWTDCLLVSPASCIFMSNVSLMSSFTLIDCCIFQEQCYVFCVLNSPYTSVFEGRICWPMLFKMYWQVACRSCKYFQLLHLYLVCGNLIVQNISIFYNFSPKCQFSKSLKNMMEVFKFQRHYFSALYVIFHILALEKNTLTHSLCEIIILNLWKLYFLV